MRKDDHLIYEAFQDNLTKTKQALGQNIMRIVKHGMPEEKDIPNIKLELTKIFTAVKKAGDKFTPEQEQQAKGLIAQLRNAGMPENELRDIYRNAPTEDSENYSAKNYADEMERKGIGQKISGENAEKKYPFDQHVEELENTSTEELIEDLKELYHIVAVEDNVGSYSYDSANLDIEIIHDILKKRGLNYQKDIAPIWDEIDSQHNSEEAEHGVSPGFHHDPSHHLMQGANQIADILNKTHDDEATPEHIEQMALKILGPQSEYKDYNEFNLALKGVIALLNRYVVVSMNEGEESGMPTKEFMSLKQYINKGPIKVNKPTKELPYTHKYINQLAKQDPREGQREENAEKRVYDDVEVAFNLNGREYIAYGDVHFGEEGIHGKGEDTVENFVVLDAQTRQEIKDGAVLKHGYNAVYNAGVNQSAEENGEDEGELMTHMKQTGMIPKGAKPTSGPHTTREKRSENEERRLDPKCWKGYHKQGTKLKGGKRVNNCVKNS